MLEQVRDWRQKAGAQLEVKSDHYERFQLVSTSWSVTDMVVLVMKVVRAGGRESSEPSCVLDLGERLMLDFAECLLALCLCSTDCKADKQI